MRGKNGGRNGNHVSPPRLSHDHEPSSPKPTGYINGQSGHLRDYAEENQGPSSEVLRRNYLLPPDYAGAHRTRSR